MKKNACITLTILFLLTLASCSNIETDVNQTLNETARLLKLKKYDGQHETTFFLSKDSATIGTWGRNITRLHDRGIIVEQFFGTIHIYTKDNKIYVLDEPKALDTSKILAKVIMEASEKKIINHYYPSKKINDTLITFERAGKAAYLLDVNDNLIYYPNFDTSYINQHQSKYSLLPDSYKEVFVPIHFRTE